jgi:hypothetical protein
MEIKMDLVDEMMWEDVVDCLSLEAAGLEEPHEQPIFGGGNPISNGIFAYTAWFYDGDESAFGVI